MRKVTLFYQQTAEKDERMSAAATFGELKQDLGLEFTNKKVMVRETRNTLEADDAVLPQGDIILFVYPENSKAGALKDLTIAKVKNMAGNNLRRCVRRLSAKGEIPGHIENYSTEEQREALIMEVSTYTGVKKESKPVKKAAKAKPKAKKKPEPIAAKLTPPTPVAVKQPRKKKPALEVKDTTGQILLQVNGGDADLSGVEEKLESLQTKLSSLQDGISSVEKHIVSFGENLGKNISEAVLEALQAKEVNNELEELAREANLLKEQLRDF